MAQALRLGGYAVVDVPLSMLVARVAVQCPHVILIDADSDGALDAVGRMRELPDADDIHVLFIARPGGAVSSPKRPSRTRAAASSCARSTCRPSCARSRCWPGDPARPPRPHRTVCMVATRARRWRACRLSRPRACAPSPSRRPRRCRRRPSRGPRRAARPSRPARRARHRCGGWPASRRRSAPSSSSSSPTPRCACRCAPRATRCCRRPRTRSRPCCPQSSSPRSTSRWRQTTTRTRSPLPAPDPGAAARTHQRRRLAENHRGDDRQRLEAAAREAARCGRRGRGARPRAHPGRTNAGPTGGGISTTGGSEPRDRVDRPRTPVLVVLRGARSARLRADAVAPARLGRREPGAPAGRARGAGSGVRARLLSAVLGPGEAMPVAARAIASRTGGSLCFVEGSIERRLVLREGDIVTVASTSEDESLLAFLGARGELPRETVRKLSSKFPPFGRHAGAALVARATSARTRCGRPSARTPSGCSRTCCRWARVASSPRAGPRGGSRESRASSAARRAPRCSSSSFAASCRRPTPSSASGVRGRASAKAGRRPSFVECALGSAEESTGCAPPRATRFARPSTGSPRAIWPPVIYALSLSRWSRCSRPSAIAPAIPPAVAPRGDGVGDAALDAEAIRERVRARAQIVDDGDYFAVLGVAHDATGYEVRRAFLELRRAFDPSRMLTPEVADLAADVRKNHGRARRGVRDPERHGAARPLPPRHRGGSRRRLTVRRARPDRDGPWAR